MIFKLFDEFLSSRFFVHFPRCTTVSPASTIRFPALFTASLPRVVLGVHAIGFHFSMSHFPAVQPLAIGKTPMHASAHIGVKRIPIQAALENSSRDSSEIFCSKIRFAERRNTLCTRKGYAASVIQLALARLRSNSANREIGAEDPPVSADAIVRCCLSSSQPSWQPWP